MNNKSLKRFNRLESIKRFVFIVVTFISYRYVNKKKSLEKNKRPKSGGAKYKINNSLSINRLKPKELFRLLALLVTPRRGFECT